MSFCHRELQKTYPIQFMFEVYRKLTDAP